MRTIDKMRLLPYSVIAAVLLSAITETPWLLPAIVLGVGLWHHWWYNPRCPRCGEVAGLVHPKYGRSYVSYRGICARCGADFHKE